MYGGSGASPAGLALQPQAPAALAERLQQLDRAEPLPGPQLARGTGEPFPGPVLAEPLEQQHLRLAAARPLEPQPGRQHARVVHDDERPLGELGRQLVEAPVPRLAGLAVVDEEPRAVPPLGGLLRDQLARATRSPARTTSSDPDVTVAADD